MDDLWEFLSGISWMAIITILVLGGALSFIGDRVGMKFAKRRVSLFGLRPKYTGSLITAITGVMISLCVMVTMAAISETVRTALFSMKFLEKQLTDLTQQLQESRNDRDLLAIQVVTAQDKVDSAQKSLNEKTQSLQEVQSNVESLQRQIEPLKAERASLQKETASLSADLETMRETLGRIQGGKIIAFADERIGQEVVPEGTKNEADVQRILSRLNERIRYEVARRSGMDPKQIQIVSDEDMIRQVEARCLALDSRKVIRASVASNIVAGEPVTLTYHVFESSLVFEKDEELLTRTISTPVNSDMAETLLNLLLRDLNRKSSTAGVMNDPLTGMVGDISANDFFDATEKISKAKAPFKIIIYAENDVFTEGPVRVRIVVDTLEKTK